MFEKELLKEDWTQVAGRPGIQVKLLERDSELYVLTRSAARADKERAIGLHALRGLRKDLTKLAKTVRSRRVRKPDLILKRLGRFEERWPIAWPYLKEVELTETDLVWSWDGRKLPNAKPA